MNKILQNWINTFRLARRAFGPYRVQIIFLTILGFVSGTLEGLGVNALIPLLSFVIKGEGGEQTNFISRTLEQFFTFIHVPFTLKYLLIFICLLFIAKAIILLVFNYIKIRITTTYEEKTRNTLLQHLLKSNWPYLSKQKTGYFEKVLMNDVDMALHLLSHISSVILVITNLFIYTFIALNIAPFITFLTVGTGAVLFFLLVPFAKKTKGYARINLVLNQQIAHHVNESIYGMKTIKAMHKEDAALAVGSKYFRDFSKLRVKLLLVRGINPILLQPIGLIFIAGVFAFSYVRADFNFAIFVATIYLIQNIFTFVEKGESILHRIYEAAPYLQKVLQAQDEATQFAEKNNGQLPFRFSKILAFESVSFTYPNGTEALSKVSFEIKKGEMVGIIGPSGSGKTTMVDLLLRLLEPTQGNIVLDGVNIGDIDTGEWRTHIGYVSQDLFVKNDTIANNIRFYNPNLSDKEMKEAARKASLYDFIQTLPNQWQTKVGERGVNLSGGQKQRLILARVLATKPDIIVLDEATSALDAESEEAIQKSIHALKGSVTVLTIAHRLMTVQNSDRLVIVQNGQVVEQGLPADLLKNKDSYFYKVSHIRK